MADISKITLPSGTSYNLKDAQAREDIQTLQTLATGAMHYIGISTTAIIDEGTQKPTIDGTQKNMSASDAGAVCIYEEKEYVWNGTKWQEFGSTGSLKSLAFKDTASGSYTPEGSVSQPIFSGTQSTVTITATNNTSGNYQPKGSISTPTFSNGAVTANGEFTPNGTVTVTTKTTSNQTAAVSQAQSGTVTYTPTGSVSAPDISVKVAGLTTTVNSITDVGTLPYLNTTVIDEILTIEFNAGTLPTKGSDVTVKIGDADYQATKPSFTGTGVRLVTGNIAVPNTYTATFTGTKEDINVTGTATGTISKPSFTGTVVQLEGVTTASGTVTKPTFSGTQTTISVS